jgi:Flp pilus assembly protein TadG
MRSVRTSPRSRGQATVELALVLPLVLTLVLALVQVGLVARDTVRVAHAARSGARAAAVGVDDSAVRRAAIDGSGLSASRLTVVTTREGEWVTVAVSYRCPTDVPLVGAVMPAVVLRDQLTMRVED